MTRTIAVCGVLCALLLLPTRAIAHPGHDHTVMGTVKSVKDGHVEIEAKDGKVSTFMIADTTRIMRGKEKAVAADIKVGERIVAIGAPPAASTVVLVAKEIRLGAAGKVAGSE